MIRFLEDNRVSVHTERYGTKVFSVPPMPKGMKMMEYMDLIMDTYWYHVGKNRRIYDNST